MFTLKLCCCSFIRAQVGTTILLSLLTIVVVIAFCFVIIGCWGVGCFDWRQPSRPTKVCPAHKNSSTGTLVVGVLFAASFNRLVTYLPHLFRFINFNVREGKYLFLLLLLMLLLLLLLLIKSVIATVTLGLFCKKRDSHENGLTF